MGGRGYTVAEIWSAYSRYLYLHRLRDIGVLFDCIEAGPGSTLWAEEGFAVAETPDPRTAGRFAGLVAGAIAANARETTLVVRPDVAAAQLAETASPVDNPAGAGSRGSEVSDGRTGDGGQSVEAGAAVVLRRFYALASLDPTRLARDAGKLAEEVVAHLNALEGTDIEVTIEISATNSAGFGVPLRKLVEENAQALRFQQHGFEPM